MLVAYAKANDVIETLTTYGCPTGNVYKMGTLTDKQGTHRRAWRAHKQGPIALSGNVPCRLVSTEYQF